MASMVDALIRLQRSDSHGFGFSIIGGAGSELPPVICDIVENSPAAFCEELQSGDVLLEVNSLDVQDLTTKEVLRCLRLSGDNIIIKIRRDPVIRRKAAKYFNNAENQDVIRRAISQEDLSGVETIIARVNPPVCKKTPPPTILPANNNSAMLTETLSNHECMHNGSSSPSHESTRSSKQKKKGYEAFVMTGDLILNLNTKKTSPRSGKRISKDVGSPDEESKTAPCSPAQLVEETELRHGEQQIGSNNYVRTSRSENCLENQQIRTFAIDLDDKETSSLDALHYTRVDAPGEQKIVWTLNAPNQPDRPPESKVTVGYFKDQIIADRRRLMERLQQEKERQDQVTVTVKTINREHHHTLSDGEVSRHEDFSSSILTDDTFSSSEQVNSYRNRDQVVPGADAAMDYDEHHVPPHSESTPSTTSLSTPEPPSCMSPLELSPKRQYVKVDRIVRIEESVQTENTVPALAAFMPRNTTSTSVQTDDALLHEYKSSHVSPKRSLSGSPKSSPSRSAKYYDGRTPTPPGDLECEHHRVDSPPPLPSVPGITEHTLEDDSDSDSVQSIKFSPKAVDAPSAYRLAKRLYYLEGFRKSDVWKHLCKKNDYNQLVAQEYLKFFDFTGDTLDVALRKLLAQFALSGETQERERILAHFSQRYLECNPERFSTVDSVHKLTCGVMLLNTDLHGQNIGKKMSCGDFLENLAHMNDGRNFPRDVLKQLYHSIKSSPLPWAADETEEVPEEQKTQTLSIGHNPFLTVPDTLNATQFKSGFVMRKCCMDANGRKTPFGKRSWKMFHACLRDMVLYLSKDESSFKKNTIYQNLNNGIRIHHSLASKATDYTKKQHVFRLQTAEWAEYLFQTGDSRELQTWIDMINFVAASMSAPPLPCAVGSQKKFQRPLLPCSHSRLSLREQLIQHEIKVDELETELDEHRVHPPKHGSKSRIIHDFNEKEIYLQFEIKRYKTYVYLLQSHLQQFPEMEPPLTEHSIGEVDESRSISPSQASGVSPQHLPSAGTEQHGSPARSGGTSTPATVTDDDDLSQQCTGEEEDDEQRNMDRYSYNAAIYSNAQSESFL